MGLFTVTLSACSLLALVGCSVPARAPELLPPPPPEAYRAVVESEVTETIQAFFAGFSKLTCADGSAISRYASDPTLYVDDTEMFLVSREEYESGARQRACGWQRHGGGVDQVIVNALGPGAAMAAWTYHDDIVLANGQPKHTRGAVMMTLIKADSLWQITSTKTTETNIP